MNLTPEQEARVKAEQAKFLEAMKNGTVGELLDEDNRRMDEAFDKWVEEEERTK